MTTIQFFFILFAIITLVSGFRVVTTRTMFHAALYLVISLFGVALMFVLLDAGFLAAVQVIVYIGAIAILIIFAVMLTRGMMESKVRSLNSQAGLAAVVSGAILFILIRVLTSFSFQTITADVPADNVTQIGQSIVGQFVLPFEVASVLLLAALIGAIYIARERKKGE
ncbi:MAG TPA: NADH-quinone oxidoreductase subunit J [Anaerolineae bacterium]|nr:NADH-quinone oxidoreductase subunit J [Anaerolineae bacterium]